jgi:5'-nucleotidase
VRALLSFRLAALATATSLFAACSSTPSDADDDQGAALTDTQLDADEALVSILATNDIHGGVELRRGNDGQATGGLAQWAGTVTALRKALDARFHTRPLLIDAGDQFQGTLLSNFNEGQLVFRALDKIGYDAVITGNHDYDFGPVGWLEDEVTAQSTDRNPRGALERVAGQVRFPVLSANTFVKASLVDRSGQPVATDGVGCKPTDPNVQVDWARAQRPAFLKPFLVREVSGVRVAIVGIDNVQTPLTTTAANVTDLCFRDEVDAYLEVRKALEGKADVFVAVAHDGDTTTLNAASTVVQNILQKGGESALHAFVAGHTHFVNNARVQGVPLIQSGSGLEMFGRIDLVWNKAHHTVVKEKTKAWAGMRLIEGHCDLGIVDGFCAERDGKALYEGEPVTADAAIAALISAEREVLAPLAGRNLGHADVTIARDRVNESALADALTDAFLAAANAAGENKHVDVATMNTGGIRDNFPAGDIRYEDLFRVLPFNNHGIVVGPMTGDKLMQLLLKSAQSCGAFGAFMQAGLKITYSRDCTRPGTGGGDTQAKVLHVETLGGEVLHDEASGIVLGANRTLIVATLDFIADGFDQFKSSPRVADIGIVREVMTNVLVQKPWRLTGQTDGRWTNRTPPPIAPQP